jgi:hypothetical protein
MANTRFFIFIQQINFKLVRKIDFIQGSLMPRRGFAISFFCLFFGFLIGSLFGTFLNGIREFIFWDGFIIGLVVLICEIVSFCLYSTNKIDLFYFRPKIKNPRSFGRVTIAGTGSKAARGTNPSGPIFKARSLSPVTGERNVLQKNYKIPPDRAKILNYFKLGLLFGFFIDAYKVGS